MVRLQEGTAVDPLYLSGGGGRPQGPRGPEPWLVPPPGCVFPPRHPWDESKLRE